MDLLTILANKAVQMSISSGAGGWVSAIAKKVSWREGCNYVLVAALTGYFAGPFVASKMGYPDDFYTLSAIGFGIGLTSMAVILAIFKIDWAALITNRLRK